MEPNVNKQILAVGKHIRKMRADRPGVRWTQKELAQKAGISTSFLSMIERGERAPHLKTLERLAKALRAPLPSFFSPDSGRLEAQYRPLIALCRRQSLSGRDVKRLVSVAKTMFR